MNQINEFFSKISSLIDSLKPAKIKYWTESLFDSFLLIIWLEGIDYEVGYRISFSYSDYVYCEKKLLEFSSKFLTSTNA